MNLFSGWTPLELWIVLTAASLAVLAYDLTHKNPEIPGIMKVVWALTVAYSGPLGLAVYFYSGRKQIRSDSLWRRGWRSTAHCYSGCGAGEIVGVFIAVGLLSLGNLWVAGVTFVLAYVAGYALTVGPLVRDGMELRAALKDALVSETASITVMELVAVGVDLTLAGSAHMGQPRFWLSLIVSLFLGFLAAWPVNVGLVKFGVKEGMGSPQTA